MLLFATEEDVEELVDENIRMKKGHRRAFLSALTAVRSGEGGGWWRGNK